ncbi:hypothetical protein Pmani_039318, partial [Petrolisthes manimaculis]
VERGGCRDGRVFPYLAHYLATGDMFYPEHEGEVMVGRLLQELTRLDLVHDLLHHHSHKPAPLAALTSCLPRPHLSHHHHQSEGSDSVRWRRGGNNNNNNSNGGEEGGGGGGGGGGGTLKVNTRRPRMVLPSLLTHLLFPTNSTTTSNTTSSSSTPYYPANTHHHYTRPPPVYRPPPNKGTTVVVVSRRGESGGSRVDVHGAPGVLPTLLPPHTHHPQHHHHHHTLARTTISTTTATATTTTTTATATTPSSRGQGLDASATCARVSLPPHDLLNILADKGYIPTVRSWWVCQETGGLITQWLVYKRGRRRIKRGTLRNRLKTRSKSIISLATDHSTRPALTLKRLLNALL